MPRRTAIILGSLAVHAVFGVLLGTLGDRRGGACATTEPVAISIEVIGAPPPPPRTELVAGGGSPAAPASAPEALPAAQQQHGRARRRSARPGARAAFAIHAIEPAHPTATAASSGGDSRGDGGDGTGSGGHRGAGIGFGDGGRIELARDLPAPPPAPAGELPAASKARPAKLIYPSRHRDIEDARLFVARVTVDDDGYVVGARLVRGFSGPRDDEATNLIFRFRYAPALDDAGRAIRSTFEQRFHVNR